VLYPRAIPVHREKNLWMSLTVCVAMVGAYVIPSSAQTLPGGWQISNVGAPVAAGTASVSCQADNRCSVAIGGAGADVWDASDQFTFLHRPLTGDGSIVVRVASLEGPDAWSNVGLMVRESLTPGSPHGFVLSSVANGVAFHRRRAVDGESVATTGGIFAAPVWLMLERRGTSIIAYRSANGTSWTRIAADTIPMTTTVYGGVAIVSRNPSAVATAALTDLSIRPAVPEGWETANVGGEAVAGANVNTHSGGVFSVVAAGHDIGGASDQFRFTYRRVSGDVDIVARVRSLLAIDPWAKAGLMIRAATTAGAAHTSVFATPGNGFVFQRRTAEGAYSVETSGGAGRAPAWVRLERRGELVTTYWSPDGSTWTFIGEEFFALSSDFLVGLAVTSHSTRAAAGASFDNVTVTNTNVPANVPPHVTLTLPEGGVVAPAVAVNLAATAGDSDGFVTVVDFVVNDVVVASDGSAPYSATWTPAAVGAHQVTAVVRDDQGATSVSNSVAVTVEVPPPPTQLPTRVSFTPSADHDIGVDYYVLDVATAILPGIPVITLNLGKPPVVAGDVSVEVGPLIASLPPGLFVVTVSAVGPSGVGRSDPSPPFTR
jgi:regulation of enolase protein 1 (concanavalin A-like superfamily)